MQINWTNISQQEFLEHYWQKQPVILKQAIPNFDDVISADELAGLAMEDFIDSRLVTNVDNNWHVEHGPFEHFENLPESHWSLLVQGVDSWFEPVARLKKLVSFLPKWQIDDVMISYSSEQAGVGAHLDQYNVFILQGQGKRRWQAGAVDLALKQTEISKDLLQLESFDAIVDEILEAGDIIYIPPFSPHQGVTLEACLNYSIGFRAPSAKELLSEFADYVIDKDIGHQRFQNNASHHSEPLSQFKNSTLLTNSETAQLKAMLLNIIEQDGEFERFTNQLLTKATRELDLIDNDELTPQQVIDELSHSSNQLIKTLGIRTSVMVSNDSEQALFYCNGSEFECSIAQLECINTLHTSDQLTAQTFNKYKEEFANVQLLTELINQGFWYISD